MVFITGIRMREKKTKLTECYTGVKVDEKNDPPFCEWIEDQWNKQINW